MSLLLALVAPVVVVAPVTIPATVAPVVIGGGVPISASTGGRTTTALVAIKERRPNVDVVMGTVTQAAPLLVRADNATTAVACARLASYGGVLNHRVAILVVQGVDRCVLGQVI